MSVWPPIKTSNALEKILMDDYCKTFVSKEIIRINDVPTMRIGTIYYWLTEINNIEQLNTKKTLW